MKYSITIAVLGVATLIAPTSTLADVELMFDGYESGSLALYTGRGGDPHHGVIVVDPLNPLNHVLSFTARNSGGDIFGPSFTFDEGSVLTLSLDYLGVPGAGVPGDLGGYASLTGPTEEGTFWLFGTGTNGGGTNNLIDDGRWHSYSTTLSTSGITSMRVVLEDYLGSGGVAGDAYFDNVHITGAPVPAPGTLGVIGVAGACLLRRRRRVAGWSER